MRADETTDGGRRRPRLLVVEDDGLIVALLVEALDGGYEVLRAGTAAQAHDLLRTERPDVLLSDYRLPDGTALAVLREADRLGVPVLAMTGCPTASAELKERGWPTLAKPFGMDDLRHALRACRGCSPRSRTPRRTPPHRSGKRPWTGFGVGAVSDLPGTSSEAVQPLPSGSTVHAGPGEEWQR